MKKKLLINLIAGYLLFGFNACKDKEEDICDSVYCNDGGKCIDGNCNCYDGFSGVFCENEETPLRMSLVGVTTKKFPNPGNRSNWDSDSGPDLYLSVLNKNFNRIFKESTATDNCESGTSVVHTIDMDINIDEPGQFYEFQIYDEDGTSDELVGSMRIVPYKKGEKFPKVRTVTFEGLTLQLSFEYYF